MSAKINAGAKILDGLRDALSGNFSRVTIEGQTWVRQDWQPIETAPKASDKFILLYCPEDDSRWWASWQSGRWYGCDDFGLRREGMGPDDVTGWAVTHWMPLPSPPSNGGRAEK